MRALAAVLLFFSVSAFAQVHVENAWTRATAPGAQVAGGYMTLRNAGSAADRLVGASSPAAARVELHVLKRQDFDQLLTDPEITDQLDRTAQARIEATQARLAAAEAA